MCPTNSIIISSNRYQVSIRAESLEGKESKLDFNPSLYPKYLAQSMCLEQNVCLLNICRINNLNDYSSFSTHIIFSQAILISYGFNRAAENGTY